MKKVYYQISILLYIVLLLLLSIIAGSIYAIIFFLTTELPNATTYGWVKFISAILFSLCMLYTFIRMARNRIILKDTEVFVPEHWGSKDYKVQYETHIEFKDINEIYLITSNNNSLNMPMQCGTLPMPYIIFECNNIQKAVNVFYFSKKQIVSIIDNVIERAKIFGNDFTVQTGQEILSEFLLLLKEQKAKCKRKKKAKHKKKKII